MEFDSIELRRIMSSNLRTLFSPQAVFTSLISCRDHARTIIKVSFRNPDYRPRLSPSFGSKDPKRTESWFRVNQRRTVVSASNWTDQKSPYETLGDSFSFAFLCLNWNASASIWIDLIEMLWNYGSRPGRVQIRGRYLNLYVRSFM